MTKQFGPPLAFPTPLADPTACEHQRTALAIYVARNGALQYLRQCLACAEKVGLPIKREAALAEARGRPLPRFDEEARERAWREMDERRIAGQAARQGEWWDRYNAYLSTPQWAVKRAKVLKRCGGICEGCGEAPATEVHHLTYDHVFDELLYELVGLCSPCHAKAHADDEER